MDFLERLVDVLQKGGPWTITAVCMLVAAFLFKELRAEQVKNELATQKLNDRLIDMTVKQVEVITVNNENQRQLIAALDREEDA